MVPTITKAQRDALYGQILGGLSGIGDVWLAVNSKNYDDAQRLGRDYSDDLRLVTDDLGWGEGQSGSIELTTPPDVLRRVLGRLYDSASSHTASQEHEWGEAKEMEERNRVVTEVCQSVLADLDATEGGSRWKISRLPSLLPRVPQSFRKGNEEPVDAAAGTRMGQGPSTAPDAHAAAGGLFQFSAILITDPMKGEDPDGNPVTQMLVVIADPDSGEGHGGSKYLLEVPDEVVERYGEALHAGDSIIVIDRLNVGRCLTATEIHLRTPPGEGTGK